MKHDGHIISLLDRTYGDAHVVEGCCGHFIYAVRKDVVYTYSNSLPPEVISEAAFVLCEDCGAAYFAPGFEEALEQEKALSMLTTPGAVPARGVRFIRITLDMTRSEMAGALGLPLASYVALEKWLGVPPGARKEQLKAMMMELHGRGSPGGDEGN